MITGKSRRDVVFGHMNNVSVLVVGGERNRGKTDEKKEEGDDDVGIHGGGKNGNEEEKLKVAGRLYRKNGRVSEI